MLYYLHYLSEWNGFFNVFRYLTFRSGGAILTSLAICLIFGPTFIKWFASKQGKGQPIRDDGPQAHIIKKAGTPTMGGVLILLSCFISILLWARWDNPYIWIMLFVMFCFGALGFVDDFLKVSKQNTKGVSSKIKLLVQIAVSFVIMFAVSYFTKQSGVESSYVTSISIPFLKGVLLPLGPFYILFGVFIIVASSNSVNLTDGLDGLAIVPVIMAVTTFGLFAYLTGHIVFSEYLQIHYLPYVGELIIISASIMGAGLGFLWYNAPPAMIFMGDTGSLSLGGALGAMVVIVKQEILLVIVGGLFVLEAASVIIQIISFKLTGKRIFRMSPIHHHYEQKGWTEATIVIRFWMIAFILALIALMSLKVR